MKGKAAILSMLCVSLLILASCASKVSAWQEQYDLGVRYLEDGNYEEAVIAFTAAIEIDEKMSEAYIGLADAYIGMGDFTSAIEILEDVYERYGDAQVKDKIELLYATDRSVQTIPGEVVRIERVDSNDGGYLLYEYDDAGREVRITAYNIDDIIIWVQENSFDSTGTKSGGIRTFSEIDYTYEFQVDELDRVVTEKYGPSSKSKICVEYHYNGATVEVTRYESDRSFAGAYMMSNSNNRIEIISDYNYDEGYVAQIAEMDTDNHLVSESEIYLKEISP